MCHKYGENSSARVAIWSIFMQGDSENVEVVSGNGETEYEITVRSTSDVSSRYTITLSNVPNSVLVSIDGGTAISPVNGNVIFENVNSFNINSGITQRTHTLAFSTPLATADTTNNIGIYVTFTQID